eukprot:scaffold1334_cov344-Prasinococcus_capsulatus_cf.AAC.1
MRRGGRCSPGSDFGRRPAGRARGRGRGCGCTLPRADARAWERQRVSRLGAGASDEVAMQAGVCVHACVRGEASEPRRRTGEWVDVGAAMLMLLPTPSTLGAFRGLVGWLAASERATRGQASKRASDERASKQASERACGAAAGDFKTGGALATAT